MCVWGEVIPLLRCVPSCLDLVLAGMMSQAGALGVDVGPLACLPPGLLALCRPLWLNQKDRVPQWVQDPVGGTQGKDRETWDTATSLTSPSTCPDKHAWNLLEEALWRPHPSRQHSWGSHRCPRPAFQAAWCPGTPWAHSVGALRASGNRRWSAQSRPAPTLSIRQ